jgi:hypothetical protein
MELVQSDTLVFRQPVQSDTFRLSFSVSNSIETVSQHYMLLCTLKKNCCITFELLLKNIKKICTQQPQESIALYKAKV